MTLRRYALRDAARQVVAVLHATGAAQADALAARTGLSVNEIEEAGPSDAAQPGAQIEVTRAVLTLPFESGELDDEPSPLSDALHALDTQGRVLAYTDDGGTVYHLLHLTGAAHAAALLALARQECSRATLEGACHTTEGDDQAHAPLRGAGVYVRTSPAWPWAP